MATAADMRQRVKDLLYSSAPHEHPFHTLVNEALDASETGVDLDTGVGSSFTAGDELEIDTEMMLVTAVAADTLTVVRGWRNTAASTHADNAVITKNPRFTTDQIDNALQSAVLSLDSWGVHAFATDSVTLVANQKFYELSNSDINPTYGILSVYYAATNTLLPVPLPFRYVTGLSGGWNEAQGIELYSWGDKLATETVYLSYAQSINTIAKLPTRVEELAVLGAVVLLLGGTIAPATHDPGARTDRTVAPGQTSRDVRFFQGEFYVRARTEAALCFVERQNRMPGTMRDKRARRWKS